MAAGDYDNDTLMEFVTSGFAGNVYTVEYVSSDSLALSWSDSLSVAGRVASGDVDGNGVEEFFVGGTQAEPQGYVHMRIYAYERVGDNQYQPIHAFNIFPVGHLYVDAYMTVDVDRDGQPELLVSFGGGVAIIKGSGAHQYSLFYYRRIASPDGASTADVTGDDIPELFTSHFYGSQTVPTQTDVFQLDSTLTSVRGVSGILPVSFSLHQNFPNPFNPSTAISYDLPVEGHITLKVYDVLGREVMTLVNGVVEAGYHQTILNAASLASGVYFYRLQAGTFTSVKKLAVMK
jgi:hypothetical protein